MTADNTTENKSWFSDLSWKTAIICALLSVIVGGSSGAGIVATKAVQTNGISQDQADVRYLTKSEADQRAAARDRQIEKFEKEVFKTAIFEAYHKADVERMDRIEKTLERILENQSK